MAMGIRTDRRRTLALALGLLVVAGSALHGQESEGGGGVSIAQDAYVILARSCAPCHSSTMERPKGNFGFVLDLGRLGRAGEYVVRGNPEASGLLRSITDGSMPPPRGNYPPLTAEELETLSAWIREGAPAGPIDPQALPELGPLVEPSALVHHGGALHPPLVHFPIGLLVAAALAEVLFVLTQRVRFRAAAEYCLVLGTAGAVVATLSGWLFAADLGYGMATHRWLGVATSLFAMAACRLATGVRRATEGATPPGERQSVLAYRAALLGTIAMLLVTGHLGGTATWGG